jgi:hypothetical protein
MNDETPKRGRNWLPVLLVTAAAAVALPVSAAVAGGDGDSARSGTTAEQPGFAPVQEQAPDGNGEQGQERRDGHDCPEGEQGGQDDSEGADSNTTAL